VALLNDRQFRDLKLNLNPAEAMDAAWLNWTAVKNKQMGEREVTPWLNLFLDQKELIQKIEAACQN
jgi:isopentenyldiphosphate isomerase